MQVWDEKQSPQSLSLEGFSLVAGRDLFSEEVTAQLKELQGQDLVASYLEALQVLEPSSLPLMWISGAKFTLYPDPPCNTQQLTYSEYSLPSHSKELVLRDATQNMPVEIA